MRLVLIISFHVMAYACLGQSKLKATKITLEVKDISFDALIDKLRRDYDINIVYGVDRIKPGNQRISINVINMPLLEVMAIICNHYNLSVEFMNHYVLLSPGEPKLPAPVTTPKSPQKPVQEESQTTNGDTSIIEAPNHIEVLTVIKDEQKDSVVYINAVEKNIQSNEVNVAPPQPKKKHNANHFISVSLGADWNQYHFKQLADPNQEYASITTIGYSLSYHRSVSKKFKVGMGATCSRKEFSYNRNFKILFPDDPVSIPNITTLSYQYFEIPVEVSYQIQKFSFGSLAVVSGINSTFLLSKTETTEYLTHGDPDTKYFIENSNSFLFGAMAGIRASIKVHERLSLFCEPRYIKYFKPVNSSVMDAGTGLFRLNAGLAIQLNRQY